MAKGKSSSASKKAQHAAYTAQSRCEKNRARKLARHMRNHPNDAQAESATKNIKGHIRKAAGSKGFVTVKSGYQVVGTKKISSKRTGKTVEVEVFKLFYKPFANGRLSNALRKASVSDFYSIETRVSSLQKV